LDVNKQSPFAVRAIPSTVVAPSADVSPSPGLRRAQDDIRFAIALKIG